MCHYASKLHTYESVCIFLKKYIPTCAHTYVCMQFMIDGASGLLYSNCKHMTEIEFVQTRVPAEPNVVIFSTAFIHIYTYVSIIIYILLLLYVRVYMCTYVAS